MKIRHVLLFVTGLISGFLFFSQQPEVDYAGTAEIVQIVHDELSAGNGSDPEELISGMCRQSPEPAGCRKAVKAELDILRKNTNITDYN